MSQIQCWEMLDSMSGSVTNEQDEGETREVRRRYMIGQTVGFNDTVSQISLYAPSYVNSDGAGIYWVRKRLDVTCVGNSYFDCTAIYQTLIPKFDDPANPSGDYIPGGISWDTTGHTEHITQALSQTAYGETGPDFENAINVSGDSVNGLDVVRPCLKYSETWILPLSVAASCAYVGAVYRLTGTVNASAFRCFSPGECLFLGARGQWQGDQPYVTVTFDFEARPNQDLNFSPNPPGVQFNKKGWEYIWIRYATDVSSDTLVQKPVAVYKAKVYEDEDWADLGIVAKPAPGTVRSPANSSPPLLPAGWNQ